MSVNKNNLEKCLKEISTFHKVRLDEAFLELDIHKITDNEIPDTFTEKANAINKETNLVMDTVNYLINRNILLEKLNLYLDEMSRKSASSTPLLNARQIEELANIIATTRRKLLDLETEEENNNKKEKDNHD
jgi:hypothetical protein